MIARRLSESDREAYDDFLRPLAATSMFLRANVYHAGLDYGPARYQGHYFGAFEGERLVSVLALYDNGNAVVQAPAALDALIDTAKRQQPDFRVKGANGPDAQVRELVARLAPTAENIAVSRAEGIFHVRLADLAMPPQLASGAWRVRRAEPGDTDTMAPRLAGFSAEGLGARIDAAQGAVARADIERWIAERRGFVLEADGAIVAQCAFNGQLPDVVQVGGVFTPPELRARGYGRAVVAGALSIARGQGVQESLLFTQNPLAERAYQAIGYRRVADYYLALFHEGVRLGDVR